MSVTPLKIRFGKLLKDCLKNTDYRQNDLAARLQVTGSAVSQMMHGKIVPNQQQLDAICALAQRGGSAERRYTLPQSATVRIADGALTMAFSPAALPKAALVENVPLPWGNFELTLLHKPDGKGISLRAPEDGEIITVAPCDLNARLTLDGANGARSVKRLCIDRKLSLTERDALPALYVGGQLAAVWRLGTDVTFLPEGGDAACFVRIIPR